MRKYWKSIAIVVVAVLGIGMFYIQSSMAAVKNPEFMIKKKSGDEAEAKGITLEGSYYTGNSIGDYLWISTNGTEYRSSRSYIEALQGIIPPEISRLQQEYRNFMRGKLEDPILFFENKDLLVYANVEYNLFHGYQPTYSKMEISVLDKQTDKSTSFEVSIPEKEKYSFMHITGIYVIDGNMKIVTANDRADKNHYSVENHVYTIDIKNGKLLDDELIDSATESPNEGIYLVNSDTPMDDEQLVFEKVTNEEIQNENGEIQHERKDLQLIIYDLKTGEQEQLELPKEVQQDTEASLYSNSTIYLVKRTEEDITIHAYNLGKNKMEATHTFNMPDQSGYMDKYSDSPTIQFKNERIYMVSSFQDRQTEATIFVGDLNSGKMLYEGTIGTRENEDISNDYTLNIHYFHINQ